MLPQHKPTITMKLFLPCILFVILAACSGGTKATAETKGSVEVRYARHFRLAQKDGYVELKVLQPETGEVERTFALVKAENKAKVPAGADPIEVPLKNAAVLSTTHIGMLDAIGALDCIKGSTDANFVANRQVLKGIRSGTIAAFGDEVSITPERLLEKEITLVVISGFGKEFPNQEKLQRLGIEVMANYEWREEHPLGKAEWVKVFGYLTGKEKEAEAHFAMVEKAYGDLKAEVRKATSKRPKVLVGSLIGDVWYAPAGESYMARVLDDGGADYIYRNEKGTGSCEHTLEQVFKHQQDVNIWINSGAATLSGLKDQQPKYALFTAFKAGNVYCYTHNSNYFWEMSAANPHWLLSDFAVICGIKSGGKLHFYRQLTN